MPGKGMREMAESGNTEALLAEVRRAVERGDLTDSASRNIARWLTESAYATYADEVARHIRESRWQVLGDVFWTVIPFGTGGRRGKMYPIGTNAINDRTIGESAQGLATYVRSQLGDSSELRCGIAYDTRHRSRHFAELCASIMAANGFDVFFLDDYRSTPELSFLVRYHECHCGIMVTASHNPPSDNAVKVYWSSGGQVLPPHDAGIIDAVMQTVDIRTMAFEEAAAQGRIIFCTEEIDEAYQRAVLAQSNGGPRDVPILYSPLHGVGSFSVLPVLEQAGFERVTCFGPHATPDGDFPNVPDHVSNPENPAVFDSMVRAAKRSGDQVLLATDPDCDRMGCCTPVDFGTADGFESLTGNQLGALLADYVLSRWEGLTPDHYVVKTLVTTELIRRIADHYGVRTVGDLLVGFKYIGGVIDREGPERFVFGTEESHGYLKGTHVRDKDGAVACLLIAELAAECAAAGQSLHDRLNELYRRHGYHMERLMTVKMPGSQGMARMQELMETLRTTPPEQLGGIAVDQLRDYQNLVVRRGDDTSPLEGPHGNLLIMDLAEAGNYVAVRPSGTEPKIKCYMFGFTPPEAIEEMERTRDDLRQRLDRIEDDVRRLAEA